MPLTEPTIRSTTESIANQRLLAANEYRRTQDWERLSRLEYIVETLAREYERQAKELTLVVQTQSDMLSHLKTIKYAIIGGLCGIVISQIGLEKTFEVLATIFGVG